VSSDDPLAPIDEIEQSWIDGERHRAEDAERVTAARSEFSADFTRRFEDDVRPTMEAIIERLQADGGGGVILERPADDSRRFAHRFTLWMSLLGEIEGTPREDRQPYLRLDADVDKRCVEVWEGDLWRNRRGGTSRKVAEWTLQEMDGTRVEREAIEILRRSADSGT
jgi:cytochrome P450